MYSKADEALCDRWIVSLFQISEELEKVKQEMEEKGSRMSDAGEADAVAVRLYSVSLLVMSLTYVLHLAS